MNPEGESTVRKQDMSETIEDLDRRTDRQAVLMVLALTLLNLYGYHQPLFEIVVTMWRAYFP